MNNQNEETVSKSLLITDQFDTVEFSVLESNGLYRVFYSFVKQNTEEKKVDQYCTIFTNIFCSTLYECAERINILIENNLFSTPVIGVGVLFNSKMEPVEELNWNNILDYESEKFLETTTKITIH